MKPCRILIIDDDSDDIEFLSNAFIQCGVADLHSVNTVQEAFAFLDSLESQADFPKLIVTDVFLPGISGTEFAQNLKSHTRYSSIPVVLLSTIGDSLNSKGNSQTPVADFINKPSSVNEYQEVANYIQKKVQEEN